MVQSRNPDGRLLVQLTQITYGAEGINLYKLTPHSGQLLPQFEPGAHIDIDVSSEVRRQYSLIWSPENSNDYLIGVQFDENGRGGSKALHLNSVVGASYWISPPRNHFALSENSARYLLLAGGIGITPIISMFRKLKNEGKDVELYYWAASTERALFLDELNNEPNVHIILTPRGESPSLRLSDIIAKTPADADLYCCGPEGMLTEFEEATVNRPEELVHRERFAAQNWEAPAGSFKVKLERSQKTFIVSPSESILDVCIADGIDVSYSCEEGICGACEVKVIAGTVEHRDTVLSSAQKQSCQSMMICCSRGTEDLLVLDL